MVLILVSTKSSSQEQDSHCELRSHSSIGGASTIRDTGAHRIDRGFDAYALGGRFEQGSDREIGRHPATRKGHNHVQDPTREGGCDHDIVQPIDMYTEFGPDLRG